MGDSFFIRRWSVSYFHEKKWVNGCLSCMPLAITFKSDVLASINLNLNSRDKEEICPVDDAASGKDLSLNLEIEYCKIKKILRARSLLVYAAVTVETNDGTVHWFSSLPDRYSVYNVLNHFALHSLLGSAEVHKKEQATKRTRLGGQLLSSVEDSAAALASAASDLHIQGRQLGRASIALLEIHEDLDVADRLLSGLNTYLGQWKLPPQYKQMDLVHIYRGDVPEDYDLEVLATELYKDKWREQQLSIIRITQLGLILLDIRQRLLHNFPWVELSRVFVVSPWEVIISKHLVGHADIAVSIVGATLKPLLESLNFRVPHLVDFQRVPDNVREPPAEKNTSVYTQERQFEAIAQKVSPQHSQQKLGQDKLKEQISVSSEQGDQLEEEVVSEVELTALRSKLGCLKAMATSVGEELTAQNKALDNMITSAEIADSRITEATARTKRLM